MKQLYLILFATIFCNIVFSQTEIIEEFNVEADKVRVDNLGYIYLVIGTQLSRFDSDLIKIAQYDYKLNGEITNVDVSDPFRLLIFYKDFNRLIFLDNSLTELRDPIYMDDLLIYSTNAVCSSNQGSFRVFDNQNSSVISFNKDLDITQKGTNLYSILGNQNVIKIKESNNFVYALSSSGEIIILDKFANFVKKPDWKNIKTFDCINDKLYLLIDSEIYYADENYEIIKIQDLTLANILDFAISVNKLYVLTEKSLITFKIL
ncbi:MAG TPA: hypothetical protein PKN32_05980 [Bacteroidales bacterium]|nr:hypothetical protein [Bacteroidales bacterium]